MGRSLLLLLLLLWNLSTATATPVVIDGSSVAAVTSSHFVCWNIDASANRGFFARDLDPTKPYGAQLARQAAAIGQAGGGGSHDSSVHSLLRFGGGGNDDLVYQVGGGDTAATAAASCGADDGAPPRCLNTTWWSNLLHFTRAASARLIFGICEPKWPGVNATPPLWDATNARAILAWTIAAGQDDLLYGLELGNEVDGYYTGAQQAANLAVLQALTEELWPDASKRPLLLGPDAAHQQRLPNPHPTARDRYVTDFFRAAAALGVPVHGATLHKYIEVTTARDTNATRLDETADRFGQFKDEVLGGWAAAGVQAQPPRLWGGEIGPHNGGSPPCNHSSMRWATFADSLWYVDSMATAAKLSYEAYCRQDFIGADYGLCDCETGVPLPDFWSAVLWTRLVGATVLAAAVPAGATTGNADDLRLYAHCTPTAAAPAGSVTAIVLNLGRAPAAVDISTVAGGGSGNVSAFQLTPLSTPGLTPATGLNGTGVALNQKPLALHASGAVPDLLAQGTRHGSSSRLALPPTSISFFVLHDARAAACL